MVTKEIVIKNRAGLHTRPSSMLVREASKYKSKFHIVKDGYQVNGKSIIGVMTLAAEQGAEITLIFEGPDEDQAAEAISALFHDGFGEEA